MRFQKGFLTFDSSFFHFSESIPDLSFAAVIREGFLRKRGGINADKALKKRFFRLVHYSGKYYFGYYARKYDRKELGVIIISGATCSPYSKKPKYFQIKTVAKMGMPARTYLIKAESIKHRDTWLEILKKHSGSFNSKFL
mmetsp:Transcript_6631/g.16181  ORF Transcript_6631/g.16181 Transcript_6631/m.16181 type:complete len:140 (+) Transcript_6631:4935-5354(+)